MHSVVLSDDHPLLLRGLCDLLTVEPDFSIAGSTTDSEEALQFIKVRRPSIAVLDIMMPGLGGMGILRAVRAAEIDVKVIFLTAMISDEQIAEALRLRIEGLLLKESAPEALIGCMRHVAGGETWLPQDLIERAAIPPIASDHCSLELLTPREREIVEWLCGGLSNKSIARKLGTTDGTIKTHLRNIYQKLGITNRVALAAMGFLSR